MKKRRNRRDGELWWRLPVGVWPTTRGRHAGASLSVCGVGAVPVEQTQVPFLLHPSTSLVWRHGAHLFFQQSSSMIDNAGRLGADIGSSTPSPVGPVRWCCRCRRLFGHLPGPPMLAANSTIFFFFFSLSLFSSEQEVCGPLLKFY